MKKVFKYLLILVGILLGLELFVVISNVIPLPFSCYLHSRYPKDYSSEKFEKISVGMAESDVIKLIGQPFGKVDGRIDKNNLVRSENCEWDYALDYSAPNGVGLSYYRKVISIKEHKVFEIHNYCGCYN